ncbi:MAG: energy transducer TonB [Luteimonas sp.]
MVLQHAHSFTEVSSFRLDTARIAAGAGAITLNVAVLLLLLVPAGMPSLLPDGERTITVVPIIDLIQPPLPPVETAEVVPPRTQATQTATRPDIVQPVIDQVVLDEGVLLAQETITPTAETAPSDIAASTSPTTGVRLEYAKAPSPTYPRDAVIAGLQGTVMLQVLVDIDGRPLQVDVQSSSGHRVLDEAARRFVLKHWTFRPAMKNGQAVQAIGIVPVAFSLD